jgi:hypothetical protein
LQPETARVNGIVQEELVRALLLQIDCVSQLHAFAAGSCCLERPPQLIALLEFVAGSGHRKAWDQRVPRHFRSGGTVDATLDFVFYCSSLERNSEFSGKKAETKYFLSVSRSI